MIKNKKTLPKILDKEQELNKEVEQAEKEEQKQQEQVKKEVQKAQNEVKKEVQKAQNEVKKEVDEEYEKRKEFMSAYRKGLGGHMVKAWRNQDRTKKHYEDYKNFDSNYKFNPNDKYTIYKYDGYSECNSYCNKRFSVARSSLYNETTNLFVGDYILIIDNVSKTAKEIVEFYGANERRKKAYVNNVEVSSGDDGYIDNLKYHSNITDKDVALKKSDDMNFELKPY